MDRQFYKKMRDRIDENLDSIEQLFNTCLVKLNAKEGFFGCEDLEGNISIIVNRGTYLHLDKNSGFTGTVYRSKRAAICVMTDPTFKQTGGVAYEMAAPVFMEGTIVGVVLLDRTIRLAFTEDDLSLLTHYAKRLGDILSERVPWPFRTWWKRNEDRQTTQYRENLEAKLKPLLKGTDVAYAATAMVRSHDTVDFRPLITPRSDPKHRGRVIDRAVKTGQTATNPSQLMRSELAVPFPHTGPVKGLVLVEKDQNPSGEKADRVGLGNLTSLVEGAVESIEYKHISDSTDATDPSARYHSVFLTCSTRSRPIQQVVGEVVTHSGYLCDADVRVYLDADFVHEIGADPRSFTNVLPSRKLAARLNSDEAGAGRPRYSTRLKRSKEVIAACPIWLDDKLVGVLEAEQKKGTEGDTEYNGPVLEVVTTALSGAFRAYRRMFALQSFANDSHAASSPSVDQLGSWADRARVVLGANILSIWTLKGVEARHLATALRPETEVDLTVLLRKLAQGPAGGARLVNIRDAAASEVVGSTASPDVGQLTSSLRSHGIRSFLAHTTGSDSSTRICLLAGTFRIGGFRPFFDTEDEMTITVLSGLLRGRLRTTQAPVAPARVPPRLNRSRRSRQQ